MKDEDRRQVNTYYSYEIGSMINDFIQILN
jgi:hypothetical protein